MNLSWGCPPSEDYLKLLVKESGYEPLDEEGYGKIVIDDDGVWVHYPDGSKRLLDKGTFNDLTDTPDSYEGEGGKIVMVKHDESGLEFVELSGIVPSGGLPEIALNIIAEVNRRLFDGSGFVEWGKQDKNAGEQNFINEGMYTYPTSWTGNEFSLGANNPTTWTGISKTNYAIINVYGYLLALRYVVGTGDRVYIKLPPPPASPDRLFRQDLVFIEVWHELIGEKDWWCPYGNVQYGSNTFVCDDGVEITLDLITDKLGTSHQGYCALGTWDSETAGYGKKWSELTEGQKKSIIKSKYQNIEVFGDYIFQRRYRLRVLELSSVYEDVTGMEIIEAEGTVQGKKLSPSADKFIREDTSVDAGLCKYNSSEFSNNGYTYAIPIALVSRRNTGAYHIVYNPNGSAKFLNTDGSTQAYWFETDRDITSVEDCFTYATGGTIESDISGRPDGLYADEVNERDVRDLRLPAMTDVTLYTEAGLTRIMHKFVSNRMRGYEPYYKIKANTSASDINQRWHDGISLASYLEKTDFIYNNFLTWCDIIGSPDNYPSSWLEFGVAATPLVKDENDNSVLPDGTRTEWELGRRYKKVKQVLKYASGTWTLLEEGTDYTLNFTKNLIVFNTAPAETDVIMVFYEVYANPFQPTEQRMLLYDVSRAFLLGYSSLIEGVLCYHLIHKVPISTGYINIRKKIEDWAILSNGTDMVNGLFNAILPKHDPFPYYGNRPESPLCKTFGYLVEEDGLLYIILIFKEIRHSSEGGSWGDDNKFQITDYVSTMTDTNGETILYGQKIYKMPLGFAKNSIIRVR